MYLLQIIVVSDGTLFSRLIERPKRQTKTPSYLSDYHGALLQTSLLIPFSHTTTYPLSYVLSYKFTFSYCSYLPSYSLDTQPKTFKQAMPSEKWEGAVNEQFHAMEQNNTWSVTSLPTGKNLVG